MVIEIESLWRWVLAAALAPAWAWLHEHFAGFWTSPVVWICIWWLADWVLGSACAIKDGVNFPTDPVKGWRPRKSLKSVAKLLGYLLVCVVGWSFIDTAVPGGKLAAGFLWAGCLVAEATSVIRNFARLFELPIISVFADELAARRAKKTLGGDQ